MKESNLFDEFFEWADKNIKINIPIYHNNIDYDTPTLQLNNDLLDRIFESWLQLTYGKKIYKKWKNGEIK